MSKCTGVFPKPPPPLSFPSPFPFSPLSICRLEHSIQVLSTCLDQCSEKGLRIQSQTIPQKLPIQFESRSIIQTHTCRAALLFLNINSKKNKGTRRRARERASERESEQASERERESSERERVQREGENQMETTLIRLLMKHNLPKGKHHTTEQADSRHTEGLAKSSEIMPACRYNRSEIVRDFHPPMCSRSQGGS